MSKESSSGRGRRDFEDQERDRMVYRFLLTLTDLDVSGKQQTPNETSIAKQWGVDDNRIFIRRMLRSVLYDEFYKDKGEPEQVVPGLTLAKLVSILAAIQKYQQDQQAAHRPKDPPDHHAAPTDPKPPRLITRSEKLQALRLFFQLAPQEREQLGLANHPQAALLQQILDIATDPAAELSPESITALYKFFLQHSGNGSPKSLSEAGGEVDLPTPQLLIEKILAKYTEQFFAGLTREPKSEENRVLLGKVKREIDRIQLQAGIEQANTFLSPDDKDFLSNHRILNYLKTDFIQHLVHSVVENERLTDEFPIYLKYFEIERVKPLPLYIKQKHESLGVLNSSFLESARDADDVTGLERQFAHRVRVHFYIKLPDDYTVKFPTLTVTSSVAGQQRLEFSEEVVGIGSPISQMIAVINRVLLWDIPVLKEYSPIAEGIYSNDEVMGGKPTSPVWSHCVVRLHKTRDIEAAVQTRQPCDAVATTVESASADFCGFDLLETAAKAALNSRLRLIKQILANQPGVQAQDYIKQLCCHVEELTALKRAQEYLSFYPFSLRAMEGFLEDTIFQQAYRQRRPGFGFEFEEVNPGECWSLVALKAQLIIAEANLKEGLLHIGRKYLESIQPYCEAETLKATIGDLLLARYHLCWFRYHYLGDLDDPLCALPDRYVAVRAAEEQLDQAETHLRERLRKYEKLDELPQSNLHPQFFLLSRIYAHRAKLFVFFPRYTRRLNPWETLLEPVRLLEKAKIYAARDGDPALYAQWSAYQSWCYIMLAYLGAQETTAEPGFSEAECLAWADRLINHAILCYSATGKICYQQIKDGGGRTTKYVSSMEVPQENTTEPTGRVRRTRTYEKYYQNYGSTLVQVMPLIKELMHHDRDGSDQRYSDTSHVVSLDVSLLKRTGNDESSSTYLFGMQSSILLFAQGMLTLCQTYDDDTQLIEAIETRALRQFTYCSAIAADGTHRNYDEEHRPDQAPPDALVLDRAFPESEADTPGGGDRLLQCLYPHRLTQFADLGKIFIIVCQLIVLMARDPVLPYLRSKQSWEAVEPAVNGELQQIRQLLRELIQNDQFPFDPSHTCGQTRYNGHLAEHYAQFEKYIEQVITHLKCKKLKHTQALSLRDQLVTDTFKIIHGDSNVMP
jgi:hypothetical protein